MLYKNLLKPALFAFDAEKIHDKTTLVGEYVGDNQILKQLASNLLTFEHRMLEQVIAGVTFPNPIGLSAGYDYDGHMAAVMSSVGFGFNTVGTVTALPYGGNTTPRLARLPRSKSLLVNKGFKSAGVSKVASLLDRKFASGNLNDSVLGISVGSSNLPEVDTAKKAIDDYLRTFSLFINKPYVSYFELNISCPNAAMSESFTDVKNLKELLSELYSLMIEKPIFVKMPNEKSIKDTLEIVELCINYGMEGFILSNLVKDRNNPALDKSEIEKVKHLKGNFSGKPTYKNSNNLIKETYKAFGKDTVIIGCGGVFSAQDAYDKICLGSSLVQLITGMVYEGPTLMKSINKGLVELLQKDGFSHISQAVGSKAFLTN